MAITIGSGISIGSGIAIGAKTVTEIFTSNGTITMPEGLYFSAKMLLVGGGGAGGTAIYQASPSNRVATGGGGAGGVVANANIIANITPGATYTITVGSGGVAVNGVYAVVNGSNSSAFGYTAIGGGGGGGDPAYPWGPTTIAASGGSGGGAQGSTAFTFPAGNSIQNSTYGYGVGFAGAQNRNYSTDQHMGGGGGGAGGAAIPGVFVSNGYSTLSYGGVGIYDNITGSTVYYAEGGGGAYTRPTGGNATPGTQSTTIGGGGGGGVGNVGATSGQNGICVIQYTYI